MHNCSYNRLGRIFRAGFEADRRAIPVSLMLTVEAPSGDRAASHQRFSKSRV